MFGGRDLKQGIFWQKLSCCGMLDVWICQPWVVLWGSQGLEEADCRVPVWLIHWKMLVQTLLPSSTVSCLWEQGKRLDQVVHSAQEAQTGELPPAFLLQSNLNLLCFMPVVGSELPLA